MAKRGILAFALFLVIAALLLVAVNSGRVDAPDVGLGVNGVKIAPLKPVDREAPSQPEPEPAARLEVPPAEEPYKIVGQLALKREFDAAVAANLVAAVDHISLMPLRDGRMTQPIGLKWRADGSIDMPVDTEFAPGFIDADTIDVQVSWTLDIWHTIEVKPVRDGRVIDIGRIELVLTNALKENQYLLTGRLTDGAAPLPGLTHVRLGTSSANVPVPTDAEGRFLSLYELPKTPAQGWFIDWSGASKKTFARAGSWSQALASPNLVGRVLEFGDIALQCAIIEIETSFVTPEPPALAGSCRVNSADISFSVALRIGEILRLPVAPGTFELECSFKPLDFGKSPRVIASSNRAWFLERHKVETVAGSTERIQLRVTPPHQVVLKVETPEGIATAGNLEIEFSREVAGWKHATELQLDGQPYMLVLHPDENAVIRAAVPGYEVVQAAAPRDATELTLRVLTPADTAAIRLLCDQPELEPESRVQVRFTGPEARMVWFSLKKDSPMLVVLPAGAYHVEVLLAPVNRPPDGLVLPALELELKSGEVRDVQLKGLSTEVTKEWSVRCGDTELRGMVPGHAYFMPDESFTAAYAINDDLAWLRDQDARHTWQLVVRDGRQIACIDLPVRLELAIHADLADQLSDLVGGLKVKLSFNEVLGDVAPKTPGRFMQLWAPPGRAHLSVSHKAAGLRWGRDVDILTDEVTVIEIGRGWGRVLFTPPETTRAQVADSKLRPLWAVWRTDGEYVGLADAEKLWLPAGDYEARPALGPDGSREIKFQVVSGDVVEAILFEPASVGLGGRALIALPQGFDSSQKWSVWLRQSPAQCADYNTPVPRGTFTKDGLLVEGLMLEVPFTLTIMLRRDDEKLRAVLEVTLQDDRPVTAEPAWQQSE